MNCNAVQSRLSAYLDRELAGDELLQLRSHLSRCDECRAEEQALRDLKLVLGNMSAPEPSADFADRLCATVLKQKADRPAWTFGRSALAFGSVAACSMMATLMFLNAAGAGSAGGVASQPPVKDLAFEVQRDQVFSVGFDPTEGAPVISVTSYAGR
jgi:anti-sigma factor RsiW